MKIKSLAVGVTALAVAAAVPVTTFAGFYPADRQTYVCEAPKPDGSVPCPGADHVVFNSFLNNPVMGDERPFFDGSINGAKANDTVNVKNGDIVTLRAYVHNNADPNKIGEEAARAKNVRMRVLVPNDSKSNHTLTSFLSADNATGGPINDTMQIVSDKAMTLEYQAGSAKFEHAPDGVNTRVDSVDDNIVKTGGASLGSIKGCFQYAGFVTLQVKVVIPTTPTPPEPPKPPVTPPTTVVTSKPTSLPNTGAGDVAAIVAGATIAGAVGYRRFLSRRLASK